MLCHKMRNLVFCTGVSKFLLQQQTRIFIAKILHVSGERMPVVAVRYGRTGLLFS